MKLPTFSRSKAPASNDVTSSPSAAATESHLSNHSTLLENGEKKEVLATSATSGEESHNGSELGDVSLEKVKTIERASDTLGRASDGPEYPSGIKLTIITASLCISVFCMALVCFCPW